MKKRIVLVMVVLFVLGNVLCVNASENLEQFEKAIEGVWEKTCDISISGLDHTYLLKDEIELPHEYFLLTEDSTGIVYMVICRPDDSYDTPTMGVITLSSDQNTMVIKDLVGGFIMYTRK